MSGRPAGDWQKGRDDLLDYLSKTLKGKTTLSDKDLAFIRGKKISSIQSYLKHLRERNLIVCTRFQEKQRDSSFILKRLIQVQEWWMIHVRAAQEKEAWAKARPKVHKYGESYRSPEVNAQIRELERKREIIKRLVDNDECPEEGFEAVKRSKTY